MRRQLSLRELPSLVIIGILSLCSMVATGLAAPDVSSKFSADVANATEHKPQSKQWFHDGAWWAIAYDGSNQRIWKFESGTFTKQTYADAAVDSRAGARVDVVWDGSFLYVLVWHSSSPKFSKYSYDSNNREWQLMPGFPVDLPISGTEVMTLDLDSSGRAWVSFENDHSIQVIWSTTPDHLSWNTTGFVLAGNIDSDDISTTIAFDDKVGVFWSDQTSWVFAFRYHQAGEAPETWSPIEIVDSGSAVDDHINAAADASGNVYVATKDTNNRINVYRRSSSGNWSTFGSNVHGGEATRPIVMVDGYNSELAVLYTDWESDPYAIYKVTSPISSPNWGTPSVYLIPDGTSNLNNVTGSRQILSEGSGLMAMASTSSSVYWGFSSYDSTKPDVDPYDPDDDESGVPVDAQIKVLVEDTGMGVNPNSVEMRIDGNVVPTTLSGNAATYIVTWTPPTALQYGRIYEIRTYLEDNAYPPLSDSETYHFKTELLPGPLSVKINFQPDDEPVPSGYMADWGQQYTLNRGRGWNKGTIKGRVANVHPDPLLDTYVDRNNSWGIARFDYDVGNGLYEITVVVGSPSTNGKHRVEIEDDVLLNGQTTDAGQFITISNYEVEVQDGQLSLFMGAAGGSSTKTQVCYFEFNYVGEAPPPPPPGSEVPPAAVAGVSIQPSGSDVLLSWSDVTTDTTGTNITVSHYNVYRDTAADFTPDRAGKVNRIGIVSGTSFSDINALGGANDYYYYVTAERSGGAESTEDSDLAMRIRTQYGNSNGSLETWISLPAQSHLASASELVASINGSLGSGPLTQVRRRNAATQMDEDFTWNGSSWQGTDFALDSKEAYRIRLENQHGWNVFGVEGTPPNYDFAFRTDQANIHWVGLPWTHDFENAQELAEALNQGASPTYVTKIAWRNPSNGAMESYEYFAGGWRGNNFSLQPGSGIAIIVRDDLSGWLPTP